MQNNLLSIFKAITPDNIKNIPVIEDSARIFIELLKENSSISSDIKIALSEQTTNNISEELPKIYLYDYYSMIENLKNNKVIVEKFKKWNSALNPSLYPKGLPYISESLFINYFTIGEPGGVLSTEDTSNIVNAFPFSEKLNVLQSNILQNKAENYYVNRLFKQSKGLKKSVKFIYDVLNEHLTDADERKELDFQETGNPFELKISGSIDKDIYRESIAYLAHPLGFTYDYTYISELRFEDNYSLLKFYKINALEVRCLSGNVETYDKIVISIIEKENYLKILFNDYFYLLQENDVVKYYDNLDNLIKIYPESNHCSIYLDYEIIYKSTLDDYMHSLTDLDLISDDFVATMDDISYVETERFKNNMLISEVYGTLIGSELISNDSNQYQTVTTKENYNISDSSKYTDTTVQLSEKLTITDNSNYLDAVITSINDELNYIDSVYLNEFNILNISETFINADISSYSDITNTIAEDYSAQDVDIFDFNFLIGSGNIGVDLLSNDSDQFETVKIKDLEDTVDLLGVSNSGESYNVANLNEEFSIEII